MPTLRDITKRLQPYAEEPGIQAIINNIYSGNVIEIRQALRQLLQDDHTSISSTSHQCLLILAELYPLNEEDPSSLYPIHPKAKVFASTGHQFNIYELIAYHHTRDYRGSVLGESDTAKYLLNPMTNQPFHPLDVAHILSAAETLHITITSLKVAADPPPATEEKTLCSRFQRRRPCSIQ